MSDLARNAIAQTLYEMLEKTPFDQITVTALISACGISRSTFYYHFKDLNDLLEWCMITHFSKVLGKYRTYATWPDGFLRILKEIYAEKDILLRVIDYVDRSTLEKALYDPVYHLLYDVLSEKAQNSTVSEDKKKFIADFYKYGFTGLVLGWIEGGFQETPEELADNLAHLMRGTFRNALKQFE